MQLLVLLFFVTLFVIFLLIPKHNKNGNFHRPPGPKGLPLIGNLHKFDATNPHLYLSKLGTVHGPLVFLRLGSLPMVVIQSAKLAKVVLKTQDHNLCGRPPMVGQQKLSYNGLDIAFSPYNEYFREMKKISIVHLFSSKRVQAFAPIRRDEVSKMIQKISSLASTGRIINLSDSLMALTSAITCRIAFNKRCDNDDIGSRFHNLLTGAQIMLSAFFFSDYFPSIGWMLDKVTGKYSRLERVFKDLDEFYQELINEHLQQERPESDRQDIIDILLQLRRDRGFAFDITLDNIKALLMNIFVGGTDTSSATIVWAITELIKSPIAMKKVQDELRTVFQNKSFIEEDDLPKLEYLKAVVKETFRLHPAAPLLIAHQTIEKCIIEGYDILPKTLVYLNAWAIGRDPQLWKDPENFIPERFIGSSIDYKGQHFELIPFGAGRRICPGLLLGVATIELALANLLYAFDWDLPAGMKEEDIDTDVNPGITMHKKNPLCLVAKKVVMADLTNS